MNAAMDGCTRNRSRRGAQSGFTLLEIMVALFILVVGLLGLAGMLTITQQSEVEAFQRKQAMLLLQDMVDRITANPVSAPCYAITTDAANGSPFLGTGAGTIPVCGTGSASQQARANADLPAWNDELLGTSEKKGGADVGGIIDARGCVANPSAGVYTVSVAWRGIAKTFAPPAAMTCGKDQYKDASNTVDERLRRVISVTIRIADLAA